MHSQIDTIKEVTLERREKATYNFQLLVKTGQVICDTGHHSFITATTDNWRDLTIESIPLFDLST